MQQNHRARVFISCGQRRSAGELETAQAIAAALEEAGYAPYIAVEQQTLAGVRDNIFAQLRDAEYYLFLDFMREALPPNELQEHRGSLFSHQELAVASFLEKDVVAFQEAGIRRIDGLIGFLQANCRTFSDRQALPGLVMNEVRTHRWSPSAYNGLRLKLPDPPYLDLTMSDDPAGRPARFFHIRVHNDHPSRAAIDCYAYIDRVETVPNGERVRYETAELMWGGYLLPNAVIAPSSSRLLAALFIVHDNPTQPHFQIFTSSGRFRPWLQGPGEWDLTYRVISQSVPGRSITCRLRLGDTLEHIQFRHADGEAQ